MNENFGVGGRGEYVSTSAQFVTEFVVIFDDAIVDEGNARGAVHVGMGVVLPRGSVSGPTGVTDASGASVRTVISLGDQIGN